MNSMERIERLYHHPLYQQEFHLLQEAEQERVFCRHTLEHFLDVARIAYILSMELGVEIPGDWIYGAALLHDLGRYRQITEGIPHEEASVKLAGRILPECGFADSEIREICAAIAGHRKQAADAPQGKMEFSDLLYRADKLSRNCFACPVSVQCNWSEEKKNHEITR